MKPLLFLTFVGVGLLLGCAAPLSSNYDIVVTATESDCAEEFDTLDPPEGLQGVLIDTSAGTMTLAGDPDEVCDLDDAFDFLCPFEQADTDVDYRPQQDAVVTIDLTMSGSWTGNTAFVGVTSVDLTCAGADCDAIVEAGAADCSIDFPFTAERD
jgi:hypothetical protein